LSGRAGSTSIQEDSMSLELTHLIGPGVAVVAVAVASGNIG
jgi:hypothetical protein